MCNEMFVDKAIFNKDYFTIGEAVRVKDRMSIKPYDALVLDIHDGIVTVISIDIKNDKYKPTIQHLKSFDILEMKDTTIIKYN